MSEYGPDDTDPTGGAAYDPAYDPDDDPLAAPLGLPPQPKKKSRRPFILIGIAGLLIGALISGLVVAIVKGDGTRSAASNQPASLSQGSESPTPVDTSAPTTPAVAVTNCDGYPTPPGLPIGTIATPADGTCALILPSGYATASPTVKVPVLPAASASATRKATAKASASATASASTACTAADFQLSLTTDHDSYVQTSNVALTASVHALRACTTSTGAPVGSITEFNAAGTLVENFASCGLHNGTAAPCLAPNLNRAWKAGETDSYTDTWNQVVAAGSGTTPNTYATADNYVATLTVGPASTTSSFTISAAPTCTSAQLTAALSPASQTFQSGSTTPATFMGVLTNSGSTVCDASPQNFATPVAKDTSGATVWTGCDPHGLARGQSCTATTQADRPFPVMPGAVVPHDTGTGITTAPFSWTWFCDRDGTATADPQPLPVGTYTLSWGGLTGIPAANQNTIAVTVTAAPTS